MLFLCCAGFFRDHHDFVHVRACEANASFGQSVLNSFFCKIEGFFGMFTPRGGRLDVDRTEEEPT